MPGQGCKSQPQGHGHAQDILKYGVCSLPSGAGSPSLCTGVYGCVSLCGFSVCLCACGSQRPTSGFIVYKPSLILEAEPLIGLGFVM